MTKTHKHRTKVAELIKSNSDGGYHTDYNCNPAITGKIRGVVYEKEVVEKLRK